MEQPASTSCANCQRLEEQLRTQQAQLDAFAARFADLEADLAQAQEQLAAARKNSSTSSKPPSSDLVKPPQAPSSEQSPRSQGGQPGHPKHERALFPEEMINESFDYYPGPCCPDCGHDLRPTGFGPRIIQQVDVPEVPLYIEEHRCHEAFCSHCNK